MIRNLLPEEDALDDPDDDEADPSLPGDLWFRRQLPAPLTRVALGRGSGHVVYSWAFVSLSS